MVKLGDLASPRQWGVLSKADMTHSGHPVYGANGVIGYTHRAYTHNDPVILVGCRGTIGAIHITVPESFATGNAMALDQLDESRVSMDYLARYLFWRGFKDVTSGSSQPQLTRQNIIKIDVPLPGMAEQRRIAAILNQADAVRAKQGRMLFHLAEFVTSAYSKIVEERPWPTASLGDLGRITTGKTPPTASDGMFGGPIPFLTPGDLGSELPVKRTLAEAGGAASRLVRAGATMVCCIGATIGKVDYARQRSAFNQQINAIEWNDGVVDRFGVEAVRKLKPTILARGASTTLPLMTKTEFSKLLIQVPPKSVQDEFVALVSRTDVQREAVKSQIARSDQLFASLQSRAFHGEL